LFGFVSFVTAGAVYFIVPRLLGRYWKFAGLVRWHFWFGVVGLGFLVFDLTIAGVLQGLGLIDPKITVPAILDLIAPFLISQIPAALIVVMANVASLVAVLTVLVNPVWVSSIRRVPEPVIDLGEEIPVA
jgi:cytochrome c oxidase cbb3-type subunit I